VRRLAGLAVAATIMASAAGCVTSLPAPSASGSVSGSDADPDLTALPSLAASLPPEPTTPGPSSPSRPASALTSRPAAPGPESTTSGRRPARTTTAAGSVHVPTSAELRRSLLGGSDLPGFAVDNGADDGGAGGGGCPALDTDFSSGASASADVLLFRSSSSVFVRERLRQLTPANARAALSRVRGAPGKCPRYATTVSNLGEVTVTVGALGTPRAGDDTTAVRITMRPAKVSVVAIENLVVARRGGTLIVVTHTAIGSIDDGLTSTAIAKAYRKTLTVW
jgi:hypothetical protein